MGYGRGNEGAVSRVGGGGGGPSGSGREGFCKLGMGWCSGGGRGGGLYDSSRLKLWGGGGVMAMSVMESVTTSLPVVVSSLSAPLRLSWRLYLSISC